MTNSQVYIFKEMNWGPRGGGGLIQCLEYSKAEKSRRHSPLRWDFSDFPQRKSKVREGQISQGQALWWVESWPRRPSRTSVLQLLTSPSAPKQPSATTCICTEHRKSGIWNGFPSHWNKGQAPRVNSEATLMGKVECWSGTENPEVKQWSIRNWQAELSGPGKILTNRLRFPTLSGRALVDSGKGGRVCSFLSRKLSFLSPCPPCPPVVMQGLEPLGLPPQPPCLFFSWWVSY